MRGGEQALRDTVDWQTRCAISTRERGSSTRPSAARAEAGELCHWKIVEKMSETIGAGDVHAPAGWAVGVQREHVETVRRASPALATQEAAG
jgi:hypothetical protein